MKKKFKSKLIPYVKKNIKSFIGGYDLKRVLDSDSNVKCLEMHTFKSGETIVWIAGFGERGIFYLSYKYDKKKPYYHLVESPREIVYKEGE